MRMGFGLFRFLCAVEVQLAFVVWFLALVQSRLVVSLVSSINVVQLITYFVVTLPQRLYYPSSGMNA